MNRSPIYEIRIKGQFGDDWKDWFGEMSVVDLEHGETLITGPVADQSALFGVLFTISSLNLTLVSVNLLPAAPET